jgi:threonine aldolase
MKQKIDLRSDTVTLPSKKMKKAMINAPLGDDVYHEAPSVIKLEKKVAKLAKKKAALFVSSGTQSNLLALLSHCERGDEYICGQEAHIYKYEAGGAAVLGSIQPQPIEFEDNATLDLDNVKSKIKPNDNHYTKTKLLCVENTHNGKVLPLHYLKELNTFATTNKLKLHLDGARIYNALTHQNLELHEITQYFDSISICFSKGLGAPVGSVLIGSKKFIKKARRYRKMLGGGLRQSGLLAAACIYALDNNVKDLQNDHDLTHYLTKQLSKIIPIQIVSSNTNILFINVPSKDKEKLISYLKNKNILISSYLENIRIVLHRNINKKNIDYVLKSFNEFYEK